MSKKRTSPRERSEHRGQSKVQKVMHEFKEGELRSGSRRGPRVTNRKQAIAIAMSEQRRARRGA